VQNCDPRVNSKSQEENDDTDPKRRLRMTIQMVGRQVNQHVIRRKNNLKNIQKSGKTKRWMIVSILIDSILIYLHFKDVEEFPSEITHRTVETHPHCTGVPVVHH
jgi:hypothetical protein